MLTYRVIPCLDVADGRVVKGIRFQHLRDAGCPWELAARYEADGADEIVMLDVAATPRGRNAALDTVRRIRDGLSIPLTVGGGIRDIKAVTNLLEAGADKVAMNSAAVANPSLITTVAEKFGRQCTVVAIDASTAGATHWQVRTHSGASKTALDVEFWAGESERLGAGEILLTSWDCDGTRSGFDLKLLSAIASCVRIPIIASGGAASANDFIQAAHAGASAVLAASIFHDGQHKIGDIKQLMAKEGLAVRL